LARQESPTADDLKRFVIRMREKGLKPTACNNRIRAVNAYLKWAGSSYRATKLKEEVGNFGLRSSVCVGITGRVRANVIQVMVSSNKGDDGSVCEIFRAAAARWESGKRAAFSKAAVSRLFHHSVVWQILTAFGRPARSAGADGYSPRTRSRVCDARLPS
jgi:hypothetical protein